MIQDAFDYSEKYKTPVLFRPTTRVCHAYASIEVKDEWKAKEYEGFVKDSKKWVVFMIIEKIAGKIIFGWRRELVFLYACFKECLIHLPQPYNPS